MICSSVNLLRFISVLLSRGLYLKLEEFQGSTSGAPAYLNRTGRPSALTDLNGHALLLYDGMSANGSLTLKGRDVQETVKFNVVLRTENEIMLHLAALEGMGLVFLPIWMTQAEVESGALELVLPEDIAFGVPLHAVYPSRKYLSAKVRTFIDFVASRMG